ncbi:MAG: FtsX-like permease family protein [Methanobacteriaceae archaeon]|nr:FtsX-like permease family protein [Methanobacteriaceae archaeon]
MEIYRLSYKNLRRNWWRNFSTVIRIAFGVVILILLLSSGIGLKTFLKEEQPVTSNLFSNQTNQTSNLNLTSKELLNSGVDFFNSTLGLNLTNSQAMGFISSILTNVIYLVDVLASLIFLVGIFGITYAMDMNLLERKREIALLKLMGFTTFQVAFTHLLEAALLGFIGAIVGSIIGVLTIFVVNHFIEIISISVILPLWLPILVIILTALLSAIIALISVWFNTKIDPLGVLRYG